MTGNAQASVDVRFDQPIRTSHSDQSVPLGGVPAALRQASEAYGLDPIPQLYNEALRYAHDGHLRLARERLQVLLCMAPDDVDARLLLARVHVGGQRWSEALTALDEAQALGARIDNSLRQAVEEHLAADRANAESTSTAIRAREAGEIKNLRQETRRLRSENAHLVGQLAERETETIRWAWLTTGVSVTASLFILATLFFGGGETTPVSPEAVTVAEGAAVADTIVEPTPDAPVATPQPKATPQGVAEKAAVALSQVDGLDGADLEVIVRGETAKLVGEVLTAKQRRLAIKAVSAATGLNDINTDKITNLARTKGTTHVVKSGETLSHIAQHYYGQAHQSKAILRANKKAARGLSIGQKLKIPAID